MKTSTFSLEQLYPAIVKVLDSGGEFKMISSGTSMLPMLRDRKDTIVLIKPGSRLKKYDVPLYRRNDGTFVLHRIIGFNKDGYIMCGDNQFFKETGVKYENVVAVLKGFIKNGRYVSCNDFSYKCYVRFWHYSRGIRKLYRSFKRNMRKCKKLFICFFKKK